tara:strand:+ start:909 stop:1721 length:813 start_codon:yes stop_codon:yes gene_type:complete
MKIYYSPCHHLPVGYIEQPGVTEQGVSSHDIWDHPLHNEGVYIPPQRVLEYEKDVHVGHMYWECPAWKSYWNNTWVVFSQMDLDIEWDKETGRITKTSFQLPAFRDHILINEGSLKGENYGWDGSRIGCPYQGHLVFQMPQLLFMWLPNKDRNIWVEMAAFPSVFHKTGLEFINVEYPFSRWFKAANPAFKAHATKFSIKRGDPLYTMRFKGGKNNQYRLERWKDPEPPEWIKIRSNQHSALKQWVKKVSWNLIKKDGKCPVMNPTDFLP